MVFPAYSTVVRQATGAQGRALATYSSYGTVSSLFSLLHSVTTNATISTRAEKPSSCQIDGLGE